MYVNPFWFGFLMAIVALIVISIVIALIKTRDSDEMDEFDMQQMMDAIDGKTFVMHRTEDGYFVGEAVEDQDNEAEDQ